MKNEEFVAVATVTTTKMMTKITPKMMTKMTPEMMTKMTPKMMMKLIRKMLLLLPSRLIRTRAINIYGFCCYVCDHDFCSLHLRSWVVPVRYIRQVGL